MSRIGELVSRHKLKKQCTWEQIADKLNVSRSCPSDIAAGRRLVSPARAAMYAQYLGENVEEWVAAAIDDKLDIIGKK